MFSLVRIVPKCTKERISRLLPGNSVRIYRSALRIAAALGTSPELWLNLEAEYRLALARQEIAPVVLHAIELRSAQTASAVA